ncbi:MAG: PAS domain S-box protein [Candidatus Thiodiazotropha sp. (ex Dulcina madagascariensis)]|nr:PAS domain S-box protein [Candidatus Thiodiazotropha sp. (ex Dulcina madagascariensis)]
MSSRSFQDQDAGILLDVLLDELEGVGLIAWSSGGRITALSDSCRRLLQLPESVAVGEPVSMLRQTPCAPLMQALEEEGAGSGMERELQLGSEVGSRCIQLKLRSVPASPDQTPAYMMLVRDITDAGKADVLAEQPSGLFDMAAYDVSDSQCAKAGLGKYVELLDGIFRQLPFAVAVLDRERRITKVSSAVYHLLGYSAEEMLGNTPRMFYADAEAFEQAGRQLYQNPLGGGVIVDLSKKGGERIKCEIQESPLQDQNGVLQGYLTALGDVTERVRYEKELRRYAEMVSASSDALVFIDRDYVYRAANDVYLELWQKKSDQVIGAHISEVVGKAFFEEVSAPHLARCFAGEPVHFDVTCVDYPGKRLYVEASHNPYRDEEGRITGVLITVRDITQRHLAEQALHESEKKFRAIFDNAPIGVGILDEKDGAILDLNATGKAMLGYARDELRQLRLRELVVNASAEWFDEQWRRIAAKGKARFESVLRTKGGSQLPVLVDASSMEIKGRRILISTLVDISRRKRLEEQLREQERWRLSEIVEQSVDAILLTDTEFRITYINEAFHKLYGYTLDDLRGKKPELLNGEANAEAIHPQIYQRLRAGRQVNRELLNRRKDGTLFVCQHQISPLKDDHGKVIAYMSSQRDVSERVEGEKALRLSEEKYRQIVETAHEGIWVIDAQGETQFVNPRMAVMLGHTEEEMLGRHLFSFMDEQDRAIAEKKLVARQQGESERHDFRFLRKNGSELWVSLTADPLYDDDGQYAGAMALVSDISEARRLQQALISTQKMEAVGQLTGGIAHDFNNILGSILGFTELAQDRFGGENEKLKEYLQQIEIAGGRARNLVRQLLIFSRGDTTASAKQVVLAPLIKEVLKMLRPMLPAMVEIRTELPQHSPSVRIDPLHVQQLLMNLCINARDAIEESGIITIGVSLCSGSGRSCSVCRQALQGEWVCIRVSDSGRGVPQALLEDIFQPFVTSKEVGEGSGMGLAVVRGIVETYGGHVLVESTPGQGSCFQILLPPIRESVTDQMESGRSAGDDEAFSLDGRKVLVVDDETQIQTYLDELLSNSGAEVDCCGTGVQALGRIAQASEAYDLVVSDQSMPGMSGAEFVQALRAMGCEVPVVLCSGYSKVITPQLLQDLRIAELLQKPVDGSALMTAVRRILSSQVEYLE